MSQDDDREAGVRAAHVRRIEAFVLRARRISEHAWARDRHTMLHHSERRFEVRTDSEGGTFRHVSLPAEEVVESMAAAFGR